MSTSIQPLSSIGPADPEKAREEAMKKDPAKRDYFEGRELLKKGDYAMAGLAAKATAQGGRLKDVRLVFFAVSEKAVSSPSAETLLSGTPIADIDIEAICQAVGEDIKPFDDLTTSGGTKLALMKTLTKRATASFVEQGKKL